MAVRGGALLKYLRVNVEALPPTRNVNNNGLFGLSFNAICRRFSEEVRGTFLDKSEVSDLVFNVVKNFQKVDPSKNYLFLILIKLLRLNVMLHDEKLNGSTLNYLTYDKELYAVVQALET
uniref:Uncharacterized protein n=1 Tax=Salix viminalis TaxID=40686 RepID=A0A6N2LZ49_SALVM